MPLSPRANSHTKSAPLYFGDEMEQKCHSAQFVGVRVWDPKQFLSPSNFRTYFIYSSSHSIGYCANYSRSITKSNFDIISNLVSTSLIDQEINDSKEMATELNSIF